MRVHRLLVILALLSLVSCGGGSGESVAVGSVGAPAPTDFAAGVRKPLDASNAAIENAKATLARAPRKGSAELLQSLEAAQQAIREVIVRQEQVGQQLDVVSNLGLQIQQQKAILEQEKLVLQSDKADLERRERVWSTGFLAALFAALVALASVIGKFPMQRLEMQMKRLEIKEKELAIEVKVKAVNADQTVA